MREIDALAHWATDDALAPVPDGGLINRTWWVGSPPRAVLQWVNPIFDPAIHSDIDAIGRHLNDQGIRCPLLLPTRDKRLWIEDDQHGFWRLSTFLDGTTIHRIDDRVQAYSAGALVGRFHRVLGSFPYKCRARRRHAHDTVARMSELKSALNAAVGNSCYELVAPVAMEILEGWAGWNGTVEEVPRLGHGDLKVSNLRYDERVRNAWALLDMDTLGPIALSVELGDAWRSWCNPTSEDDLAGTHLDMDLFRASAAAWLSEGPALTAAERQALVPGIERVCLELSARFCTDSLKRAYFREDLERYPEPGTHNLARARTQLALARDAHARRRDCERYMRSL